MSQRSTWKQVAKQKNSRYPYSVTVKPVVRSSKKMAKGESVNYTINFGGFWLLAFLIIKLGGTALATWSWWWILFPIVPVLVILFQKLGLL